MQNTPTTTDNDTQEPRPTVLKPRSDSPQASRRRKLALNRW